METSGRPDVALGLTSTDVHASSMSNLSLIQGLSDQEQD